MVLLTLKLACVSLETVSPENALEDFQTIHQKVYDVYRENLNPSELHDSLTEVFIGDRLTIEYIEHFTTQIHMIDEETAIDVRQIDYNNLNIIDFDLDWIKIDADWSVGGVVSHQKHKHTRVNRYRAVYTLIHNEVDKWRIVDVKMRNATIAV